MCQQIDPIPNRMDFEIFEGWPIMDDSLGERDILCDKTFDSAWVLLISWSLQTLICSDNNLSADGAVFYFIGG